MKKIFLLILSLMAGVAVTAAPVTAEQAADVARRFMEARGARTEARGGARAKAAPHSATNTTVSPVGIDARGRAAVYAVNMGDGGFVLVGGDESADEIIGYSDNGTFDAASMPPNMRSWLEGYIESARAAGDGGTQRDARRAAARYSTKTYIPPMLQSRWGQSSPYNDQSPTVGDKRAPTGCTITATAQIMYYHRYPTGATTAIPAFTPDNKAGTNYPSLPALEPTTFDWDKILPSYTNGGDGSEVARLFKYIGTASKACYSPEASIATGYDVLQALTKYFGYDAGAYTMWRGQANYSDWVDLLYNELANGRPVLFSGTSTVDGHSFVVDGYDEEDYFHINWGWDGDDDGFYRVLLMDPHNQETGESQDNMEFKYEQVAFFGVQPAAGSPEAPARLTTTKCWLYYDDKGDHSYSAKGSESSSPYFDGKGYLVFAGFNTHNYNGFNAEFTNGAYLIKDDGSVTRSYTFQKAKYELNTALHDHTIMFYLDPVTDPELTDGDYTLYITSKMTGREDWEYNGDSENHYFKIHLDNASGLLTATAVSLDAKLTVVDVKFTDTPTVGQKSWLTVTVRNDGDAAYHGELGLTYIDDKGETQWLECLEPDIAPGQTLPVAMWFIPKKAGRIDFKVLDKEANNLYSGNVDVVENEVTDDCELTITQRVTNADGNEIIGSKAMLDLTVTNHSAKTYQGQISVLCYLWTGNEYVFDHVDATETIPAGKTVVLKRESVELGGAERYSFTTMYMRGDKQVSQQGPERETYTLVPYYVGYDATGNASTYRLTSTLKPEATVCAVDLRDIKGVTDIDTSANPNVLIFVDANSTLSGDNIVKDGRAEVVTLSDKYPFFSPATFIAGHVSLTRTPEVRYDSKTGKGWTTIVLPFGATGCRTMIDDVPTPMRWVTEGSTDGDLLVGTFRYENGTMMEFGMPQMTLEPCVPYLLGVPATLPNGKAIGSVTFTADEAQVGSGKASVTGRNFKMSGTMAALNDAKEVYVLDSEGATLTLGTHSVRPFRALFVPLSAGTLPSTLKIAIYNSTPSGITDIVDRRDDVEGPVYNLNGQRVSQPGSGIYIVGGRKVAF